MQSIIYYYFILINIEEQFKLNEKENEVLLFTDNFVFAKFWYTPYIPMISGNYVSHLPGVKEGITGSIIASNNLVINKYVMNENRRKAAAEVIKYFTSEEVQKIIVTEFGLYSGMTSIYDDEEICQRIDCEFFHSLQPIERPIFKLDNYRRFTSEFRNSIFSYLYGENTPEKALQQVIDITKYYYITASTKDSPIGLIFIIIISILIVVILSSFAFLYVDKCKPYFSFLSKPLWVVTQSGSIVILIGTFIEFGEISTFKCNLKIFIIAISITLTFTPLLYKLIINFPEDNKFSGWIEKHPILFITTFVMLDVIIFGISFISPFPQQEKYISEGQNFKVCNIAHSTFNIIILLLVIIFKFLLIIPILLLCFIEWNINETLYDLRFLMMSIYINIIGNVAFILINYMDINNYIVYFLSRSILYIFFAVNNFVFLYGYRIAFSLISKKSNEKENEREVLKKSVYKSNPNALSTNGFCTNAISTNVRNSNNISNKVVNNNTPVNDNRTSFQNSCLDYDMTSSKSASTKNSSHKISSVIMKYHFQTSKYGQNDTSAVGVTETCNNSQIQ